MCLRIVALLVLASWPTLTSAGGFPYEQILSFGSFGTSAGQFQFPYDVAVLADRLYVADSNNNRVQVFDLAGGYLFGWGETGQLDGQFRRNRGIGISPEDGSAVFVYVSDAKNDRLQRFTAAGEHRDTWGSIGQLPEQFFRPRGIAVAADGTLAVCDADNHRMKIYRADLSLRTVFGRRGSGQGSFVAPFDVDIGPQDRVYVIDSFNSRVQVFDLDGSYLFEFGNYGVEDGRFVVPKAIAVAADGTVAVADTGDGILSVDRIQFFSPEGLFLSRVGRSGEGIGELRFVTGLDFDVQNRLYVADSNNHRVTLWAPTGVPLTPESFSHWKSRYGAP
jgi:DNA-binding beta-propeller fold protein YncE